MEIKYCWRCDIKVPMLDRDEFEIASALYSEGFKTVNKDREQRFKALLDYYTKLTGYKETEPSAIMHHAIEQFGNDCEQCGKPYRTSEAKLCAACGNRRDDLQQ